MDIKLKFKKIITSFIGKNYARWPKVKYNSFIPVHYNRIKSYNPDIIYSHDLTTLPVSEMLAKEIGCKLVFDSHELEAHRNPPLSPRQKQQVESVERKLLPKCDAVTTVCQSIADILEYEYKLKDIGLIYNAPYVSGGKSHPRWDSRKGINIRLDAKLEKTDFILVYVGLITVNRGIEFVLDAMVHLPEHIKLIAVGPGQSKIKKTLKNYAKKLELGKRFIILPPVNPPDVYSYISKADASIIPIAPATLSYELALPNKFFESAFSGLPIISADLIEIKKFIEKYKLGVTYDALNVQDLSRAISEVESNINKYKPSNENVTKFKNKYGWESQEPYMLSLLERLTNE